MKAKLTYSVVITIDDRQKIEVTKLLLQHAQKFESDAKVWLVNEEIVDDGEEVKPKTLP